MLPHLQDEAVTLGMRNVKQKWQKRLKIMVLKLRNKGRAYRNEEADSVSVEILHYVGLLSE